MFYKRRIIIIVIAILSIVGIFLFFNYSGNVNENANDNNAKIDKNSDENLDTNEEGDISGNKNFSNLDEYISNMTIEEKVGQLFVISIGRNDDGTSINMDDNLKKILNKYNPGGIILFSENLDNIDQTKNLIEDIQNESLINSFISIDEEGGLVSRLSSCKAMHSTEFIPNVNLGNINDLELTEKVGNVIGTELKSLGFNMDFAPVADINTNPNNPIIGDRAFSSEKEIVANNVIAQVKGFESAGIIPVIKHFPGHGDASTDSHETEVVINQSKDRIEEVEIFPFKEAINSGVDVIMTAHIKMPQVTNDNLPATMSKEVLTGILREDLGYENIIITDALEMKAISSYWTPAESAVKSFSAGADMLLLPESLEESFNGILEAVKSGDISEERLDESVYRILKLKDENEILKDVEINLDAEEVLGSKEHLEVASEVENRSN
jgi:beta-N-acetylhexosaminidase